MAVLSIVAPALKVHASATITTDQSDYQAGSIVTIYGQGFIPGSIVTVSVTDPSNAIQFWQVSADANGNYVTTYQLDHVFGNYSVNATDGTNTATTTFHDANEAANLDQCIDGTIGPPLTLNPCIIGRVSGNSYSQWVNGNANGAKAHWREGDFVAYRVTATGLNAGAHVIDFNYDTVHGGKHATDYLGSVNATETFSTNPSIFHANNNNPCLDKLTTCIPAAPAGSIPVPPATPVNCGGSSGTFAGSQIPGKIYIYGPSGTTLDSFTYTSQNVVQGTGQCSTYVELAFHSGSGGSTVVIAWGGHIATENDWGAGQAATSINGSPYHMALMSLDGTTAGSQDRALSSNAIFFTPGVSTIVKNSAGTPVTFVTVGTTVHDTATLSASSNTAGGTAAYSLWNTGSCTGTKLSTQTVSVSNAIISDSAPFTPTLVGSYSYNITYNGDSSNYLANGDCEPFIVVAATAGLTTSVTPSSITLGPSTVSAHDTATLSGSFAPTGSITFNVFNNPTCSGAPVFTSTPVTVNGNGAYTSSSFTPLAPGTYYWIASYTGDSNNNPVTGSCGDNGEVLTVQSAGPNIITSVSPSTIILATSASSASDFATLSNGFNPTGTITFNVFPTSTACSGSPLFTSTVLVNGNGNYVSATFTPPGAGTYNWVTSYSGDSNNNPFTAACGASGETLSVLSSSPTIITEVSPATITLATTAGSASDTATLSSGFYPTGRITFAVFASLTCAGNPIFTSTLNVSGNGYYSSASFTPAGAGTYQFVASYSGDANNQPFTSPCGANGETLTVLNANPTIITQVSPSTMILTTTAGTATDTATLSGGFGIPQGTITFRVFVASQLCSGTPLFTSTVTVAGNGNYVSGAFTPPGAGIYNWVASYSGDANNNPFQAQCGDNGETLSVQQAITVISTQVSPSTITLTTTAGTAVDTATLSGGFGSPTGTITFQVFPASTNCQGTPLFTSIIGVNGNGNYVSSTFTPPGAGTYQWIAYYSGDSSNSPSSDACGASGESLTVLPASPTVTTASSISSMTLTASATSVSDTAVLSGGFGTPTGTITFNLYYFSANCAGAPLFTSIVPVNGNGNYVSASYTPLGAGHYNWRAIYSGDANNNPFTAPCDPDPEEFIVLPASPSITTSVSPSNVTLATTPSFAIDTATLSGGFGSPTGTITFRAYFSDPTCTGSPVFTSTIPVNGNGNYSSASFTPSQAGTYLWIASYSGDSNNNPFTAPCGDNGETLTAQPAGPTITTTVSPSNITSAGSTSDTATLSGGSHPTGTITFTVFPQTAGCNGTSVFTSIVNVNGNGNYQSASFANPVPGTYNWVASYSGDSNNNGFTASCGAAGETLTVLRASPTVTTTASPSSMTLTTTAGWASDTAVLSNGSSPSGNLTFTLFYANQACSGTPLFTSTVAVNGNGNYASASYAPLGAGVYNWVATYSGDANNNGFTAQCGANGETLTVNKASPTVSTNVLDSNGNDVTSKMSGTGVGVHDTATLSGAFPIANGTLTYFFYQNGFCSGNPSSSQTVAVSGGIVPGASPQILPLGTYGYMAVYSGDSNNRASTGVCEPFTSGIPINAVTDTPIPYGSNIAMCNFDTNTNQPLQQFRLLFTQNSSSTYGLTASNPGQFVYNIFQFNGTSVSVTASIPYPFVTQGAVPVHIYDSVTVVTLNGRTCFVPGHDVTSSFTVTPGPTGILALSNYPGNFGTFATVTVNGPLPSSGQAYIWIHLDYGLKKTTGYRNVADLKTGTRVCDLTKVSKGDDNDANATLTGTAKVSICDNDHYSFSATGSITLGNASSTVTNNNVFKRDPGIAGIVQDTNGGLVQGATVRILDNNGNLVATVTTDQDGFFSYAFKYTGKQVSYSLVVTTSWCTATQSFSIKSNQFVWVSVTVQAKQY